MHVAPSTVHAPHAKQQAFLSGLRPLAWSAPFGWLKAGAQDLRAAWPIALFYGLCFWGMALAIGAVFQGRPAYTLMLVSSCFLIGPFLAMGLYEVSRRREARLPQSLSDSLTCWDQHIGSLALLVLLLLVLALLWGRASLVVFAVFFQTGMPTTASVMQAVFAPQNYEFLMVYVLVGSLFAGLTYASCVISIPMILDRDTDAITAGLRSFQLVLTQPGVMLLWGLLIVGLLLASLALPWGCGLLLVAPWLGHASWHAYRAAIDPLQLATLADTAEDAFLATQPLPLQEPHDAAATDWRLPH